MPPLPSGTVTFLFADMEGSTRLLQHLGDRYASVLKEYRQLMQASFRERGGQQVDSQGDAVFVAFSRARDAVIAAVAAQRALAAHPWPDGAVVRARMGLHTGEPLGAEGAYVGMDVHRAARIGHAGHGGQIVLSQTTHDLVAEDRPDGVSLRDLGRHRLKDLTQPQHLYQVVAEGLPADFPPLRTLEAHPNNLPLQLTSFVGRQQELRELARLLERHRLVTLIGAGGSGKTRLALQVGAAAADRFPDGVWWVDLAGLNDPGLVPQTLAAVLRLREQPGRTLNDALRDFLQFQTTLLLLDNCEHLLPACAHLAGSLLPHCPDLRILATSREGLAVGGEALYPVPPLALPDLAELPPPEALGQVAAVQLFVDRATAVLPSFTLQERNAAAVAQICHRLDGIPLAVELAAARVTMLSPEQIAARLDDQFRLLTGGSRTALPRHQTLQAAMDWSFQSLGDAEKLVFLRLSVFAGGFVLDAADAVCAGDGVAPGDMLDLVSRLVAKSLIAAVEREGEVRYRLLEPIRQYARDRLRESGETDTIRGRHLAWCLALAEEAEPALRGHGQVAWLRRMTTEHENLRAALGWALAADRPEEALRLAAALMPFWELRTHYTEGRRWLQEALARSESAPIPATLRAKGLSAAAWMAATQHEFAAVATLAEQALSLYREAGDVRGEALSLFSLGYVARWRSDFERAAALFREGLRLYESVGDRWGAAEGHSFLGTLARVKRQYPEAMNELAASLDLAREVGDRAKTAGVLYALGLVARAQGLFAQATGYAEQVLALSQELEDAHTSAHAQLLLASVARHQGDYKRAVGLHEQDLPLFQKLGDTVCTATTLTELGLIAQYQGDLDRAAVLHRDALRRRTDLGDKPGIAECLERLSAVVGQHGEHERAARLLGAAAALRRAIDVPPPPVDRPGYERLVATIRTPLGEAAFQAAFAAGGAMPLDAAVADALAEP
jgi:predicted ATPase/class 3 adenylate cyclase